ncbi:neuraminidase-like domain-containing protein [Floridanema evergladense]|uniref:Neuraminidase-like domain-containing protein n=1 Tax=Floridaenema evergladense BLCC-F167 TaxID=3153639 RepID=A0ABV4WE12_9CYAN
MVNPQPTRTVSGQVLRTNKTPFGEPGFTLRAFDAISPSNIVPLGNPIPLPANGSYRLSYTWQSTGGRNGPNLLVRVFNPQGTIVGEATKSFAGMQETLNITVNVPPPPPPPPNFTLACTVRNQLTTTTIPNLRVEATFRVNNQILLTRSGTTNAEGLVLFNLDRAIFNPIPQGQSIRVIFQVYQEVQLLPTSTTLPNFQLEDQKVEILVNRPEWLVEELVVEGTITHRDGQPLAGILVQTVDRDLRDEHPLGEQVTNNQGAYRILYNRARFNPADRLIAGKSQADIRFRLFDPARQPLTDFQVTAPNAIVKTIKIKNETGQVVPIQVIFNAPAITVANLSVNDTRFRSESEYDRHLRETAAVLGNIPFRTVEDIELEFLAPETDIPAQHLTFMRAADTLAAQTNIIAEAFYGLFRQNLPTDVGLLSIRTAEEQRAALKQSIADNIISNRLESNLEAIVTQLQNLLTSYAAGTISGGSALGNLLNTVLPDTALRRQFVTEYAAYDGKDSEAFWARLRTQPAFQNGLADNIRFTFEISTLTHNHLPLVQLLQQERTQGRVRSFKDLARLDESGWLRLINTSFNGRLVGIPEDIPGENATEKARNYAGLMTRLTEASFPTVAIAARLEQDNLPGKADLLTFLTNNPEFEIDRTPFRRYVNERGTDVLRGVQNPEAIAAAQRTFMIARRFALMKPLLEAQLDSALAITRLGETRFVANYAQAMGGQTQAQLVYQRADQRTAYATAWLAKHNFAFDRVRSWVIPTETPTDRSWVIPTETPTDLGPTLIPDLEVLFGSLTACACEHCRSVYSPAAYLVDSLAFLSQNELLDDFQRRRPDISGLKLSCKNTNTPLPYIDLVNEVLEQKIAGQLDDSPPQTEGTPEELLALPEHMIEEVYRDPLRTAIYPSELPFDLWLETIRVYLKHLGTRRAEIMQLFTSGDSPALTAESLGINERDYEILTGKDFNSTNNATLPDLYEFFGYQSARITRVINERSVERSWTEWIAGAPGVGIPELLDRTEISYHELLNMLASQFVNPGRVVDLNAFRDDVDCDLSQYTLADLTPAFLDRLHRFLRLWRVLGWSIADLDLTLQALGKTASGDIRLDEFFLQKLPQVLWLKTELRLSIEELTCFYSTINTAGENPLYLRLFQNKAITNPVQPDFALRTNRSDLQIVPTDPTQPIPQIQPPHIPVILAAFRINEADWATLMSAGVGDRSLTLANLSHLYRYVLLARVLRLRVSELLWLRKLIDEPFELGNPTKTVRFIEQVKKLQPSRFKIAHLAYLYLHNSDVAAVLEPSDEQMQAIIRTLRTGLKPQPDTEPSALETQRRELIIQTLADTLKLESAIARLLLEELLRSHATPERPAIADFLSIPLEDSNPPGSETIPDEFRITFTRLQKTALLVNGFELTADELRHIAQHRADFANFDLNQLPISDREISDPEAQSLFQQWERLHNYCTLRDRLPKRKTRLIEVFAEAVKTGATPESARAKLVEATGWNEAELVPLSLPELRHEIRLVTLQKQIALSRRVGVSISQLATWATEVPSSEQTTQIRQIVKAKYDEKQWLAITRPLEDHLREQRRKALVAYLIHRPRIWLPEPKVTELEQTGRQANENLLYEHFLIDVEMSACQLTSRVRQAIAVVQLFVQRCLMGLEGTLTIEPKLARQWETWMKTYRFWEANRKVFVYPENWIRTELLDNKTPFFKDLENGLLQNDVTQETVENAFRRYLEQLNEVARLDIVGMYVQEEARTIHVFGRTPGIPHRYFYRKLIRLSTATKWTEGYWTPWEKVEVEPEGDHLIPVVWNRRLYLFWAIFTEKAAQGQIPSSEGAPREEREPQRYWEIQLAYSEYHNGQWSAKVLLEEKINSIRAQNNFSRRYETNEFHFRTINRNELAIIWYINAYSEGRFTFSNCGKACNATYESDRLFTLQPYGLEYSAMKFSEREGDPYINNTLSLFNADLPSIHESNLSREFSNLYRQYSEITALILQTTPSGVYTLTAAHQQLAFDASRLPFFYQDTQRVFFITKEIPQAPPSIQAPTAKVNPWSLSRIRQGVANKQWESNLVRLNPDHIALQPNGSQSNQAEQPPVNFNQFIISSPLINSGLIQILAESWKRYHFIPFYHPYVCLFLTQLNRDGIDGLLNPNPSSLRGTAEPEDSKLRRQRNRNEYFNSEYQPKREIVAPAHLDPMEEIDFTLEGAYSQYNWELFFHAPLLIADRLMQNQQFAEAQKWFHYIFDPTVGNDPTVPPDLQNTPARFWKLRPFYEIANQRQTAKQLMRSLNRGDEELNKQVALWRENPFNPHLIARMRNTAYTKTVVMKYLDNLFAWGDYLFRQDTLETIAEATQIFILAANLLGDRPESIPPRAVPADRTFTELAVVGLDAFSNALVRAEESLPAFDDDPSTPGSDRPPIPVLYFCIPPNDKLLSYWDTVSDRLFKIRHCMNIEGVVRQLPLFDPPIDPALLVRAKALGVDLRNLLAADVTLPHYRFNFILQKANELCAEVRALGAALLSAYEKRDAEALARLRSEHEIRMLDEMRQIRQWQIDEATRTKEGLEKTQEQITRRRDFYRDIERISEGEQASMDHQHVAHIFNMVAQGTSAAASAAHLIPNFNVGISGWAGSPVAEADFGGSHVGSAISSVAEKLRMIASQYTFEANMASTMAGINRSWDDRKLQEDLANIELRQIEKQLLAADIRIDIATRELNNHNLQRENAREIDSFMRSKFTNQELYDWMVSEFSAIFFQSYQLAFEMARRSEVAYRFERGLVESTFIRFGQWDSLRRGLMAGERLQLDLRRLEMAYLNENRREYEITKHISLATLDPVALIQLRTTGQCLVSLPEVSFDLDYPGHYMRRIKSVSLTIPCVTGPYTSVNCTLTLLSNKTRISSNPAPPYAEKLTEEDARFHLNFAATQSIATSNAQNDSGLFELNFRDERYLPFEGAGAISTWRLELSGKWDGVELPQFNFDTITDVILHLPYTARDGGEPLKQAAIGHLQTGLNQLVNASGEQGLFRLFSLRHEFPTEWHRFLQSDDATLTVTLTQQHFPFIFQGRTIALAAADLYLAGHREPVARNLTPAPDGRWRFELPGGVIRDALPQDNQGSIDVFLVCPYTVSQPPAP